MKPSAIRIDICCNDPDNGLFAERAEGIQIGSEFLELAARTQRAPRFLEVDGGFRLAGKRWPVTRSKDWFGNWCWNAYWLTIDDGVAFLAWLHRRGLYSFDMGESRLFNRWRRPARFSPSDLTFLHRLLSKEALHQ